MHQWDDEAIVISVSRYGEQSAIVRVLTAQHGLYPAMVKGVFSKKWRGVFQPGNIVHAHWQARLEEQLGIMRCELLRSCTARLLLKPLALHMVNSAVSLILTCVPERISELIIFRQIRLLIESINVSDDVCEWLLCYVEFEHALMRELGFGLDLSACAATGITDITQLRYVSPKSGRAVSAEAGEPYKARLLPLPAFLLDAVHRPNMRQMLDALSLTEYFLEAWLLQPEGKKLPQARRDLLNALNQLKESSYSG